MFRFADILFVQNKIVEITLDADRKDSRTSVQSNDTLKRPARYSKDVIHNT